MNDALISKRAQDIPPFVVMDVLEKAQGMERSGISVIHLEVGEPDFDVPACVTEALNRAMIDGHTHYTHSLGLIELRDAICDYYFTTYGVSIEPDQVIVTSGSSPAIFLVFSALLEKDDQVIVSDPHYACYPNFIQFVGQQIYDIVQRNDPCELALFVTPIDLEAPKGRLILPQVQAIRDVLDNDACCMVVKERELRAAFEEDRPARAAGRLMTMRKMGKAIIFIDEIDSIGRKRGAGLGGGHDEREQTLNQLLVEMDGFESNEGVILISATNRPDVLDPALLRPGRFDRQVVVPLPDVRGREQIARVPRLADRVHVADRHAQRRDRGVDGREALPTDMLNVPLDRFDKSRIADITGHRQKQRAAADDPEHVKAAKGIERQ